MRKNPTVSARGPLVLQEDQVVTGTTNLRLSSDLKKGSRGHALVLVGETRKMFVLIISAISASKKSCMMILVGEIRRMLEPAIRQERVRIGNQRLLPIDWKLRYRC